jgi:hypothetical protein
VAIAGTSAVALGPALHAAVPGPGDITNPTKCTHGCDGGGGHTGPGGFTANPPAPDGPVVVDQPNFTG